MRKALSLVLVLALVLGSFSMAFAATPSATLSDISGNANAAAIKVLADLGIVTGNPDGTYAPAKAVNRAEFAALITRAMAVPESALTGYTTTKFKDTAGYDWAVKYLAFAETKGIMLGDGQGNAMPGRTITVNEAVTMALRAIGYTSNSNELIGAWPSNYVTLAQNLDLYDKVSNTDTVDKANAAQIVYNLLPVTKVAVATDGQTAAISTGKSLLTGNLGATAVDSLVKYNDAASINITPYIGAWATKYIKDSKIIAIKEKSKFLTGKFTADYKEFKADGVTYTVNPTNVQNDIYTNFYHDGTTNGALSSVATSPTTTNYTLAAKVTNQTIETIYTLSKWVVTYGDMADSNVQAEITTDKELFNYAFPLKDKAIDTDAFALVGVNSLSEIQKDHVVYVYKNANTNKIAKVAVGTKVVEGKVDAWTSNKEAKIGGVYYKMSSVLGVNPLTNANVGNTVKVWLDADGKVFDHKVTAGSASKYAVVTAVKAPSGVDDVIKMIDSASTNKRFALDTDLAPTVNPGVGQIVKYGLDSKGYIDTMVATTGKYGEVAFANNKNFLISQAISGSVTTPSTLTVDTNNTLTVGYNSTSKTYKINSDVVVFTYATTAAVFDSSATFDVTSIGEVTKGASGQISTSQASLFFDGDGNVAAMLIPASAAGTSTTDLFGVINTKELKTDAAGDQIYQLTGFANGVALDKLTINNSAQFANINPVNTEVALYRFSLNADGNIKSASEVNAVSSAGGVNQSLADAYVVVSADANTITVTNGAVTTVLPLAKDVKYYEVTFDAANEVDTYSLYTGAIRAGYKVWLYSDTDTADEALGYDYVIFKK